MAKQLHNTIRGLCDAVFKTPSGRLLVLPTASGAVFNPGQEVQVIEGASRLGEIVILDTYTMGRKPEIQLQWKQKNITLLGMRLGLEFQNRSAVNAKVMNNGFLITKSDYLGATSGSEGYGMAADQEGAIAYHLKNDMTTEPLTRQPFDTFDANTPKSFAQGENAAMKWSTDLIGRYVAYDFPHALGSALKLTEENFSAFSCTMMTIMTDRSLLQWDFPSLSVKLEDGDINMNEPEMSISFRVQDDGSDCLPYNVIYKGQLQRRKCG